MYTLTSLYNDFQFVYNTRILAILFVEQMYRMLYHNVISKIKITIKMLLIELDKIKTITYSVGIQKYSILISVSDR